MSVVCMHGLSCQATSCKGSSLFELKPFPGRGFLCTCKGTQDKNGDNMECLRLSTILCFSFGQSFEHIFYRFITCASVTFLASKDNCVCGTEGAPQLPQILSSESSPGGSYGAPALGENGNVCVPTT